jgi:hypothetical protein
MVAALLVTLALMVAPAAQQEARAKGSGPGDGTNPGQAKCIWAAAKAGLIGPELNPSNTTFISGTNGNDTIYEDVAADEVFCGFGGRDFVENNLGVVLGGPGNDYVQYNTGTFYGGAGNDGGEGNSGTFNGGPGCDTVSYNEGGTVDLGDQSGCPA